MPRFIDRTNQRFGKLTVLRRNGTTRLKKVLWRCRCDCGNECNVDACSLVTGNTVSCGCYLKERITKHGGWKKSSYNTWRAMMRRCYNTSDKDYSRWGGLGVFVHKPWHDYATFAAEVGEPTGNETFDRINPTGSYVPGNVRWASPTVQARNIRVPKSSKLGVIGVIFRNGRYYAAINARKKRYYSKVCQTVEEAVLARKELERIHWGDC